MAWEIGWEIDVYRSNIISGGPALCEQQEVPLGPSAAPAPTPLPTARKGLIGTHWGYNCCHSSIKWNKQTVIHIHFRERKKKKKRKKRNLQGDERRSEEVEEEQSPPLITMNHSAPVASKTTAAISGNMRGGFITLKPLTGQKKKRKNQPSNLSPPQGDVAPSYRGLFFSAGWIMSAMFLTFTGERGNSFFVWGVTAHLYLCVYHQHLFINDLTDMYF